MLLRYCISIFLISLSFPACAFAAEQFKTEEDALAHCTDGTVLWLNTNSGNEHKKGSKWYGHTRVGAYICKVSQKDEQDVVQTLDGKWKAIGKTNAFGGGAVIYVDPSSIRRQQNSIDLWVLMDFRNTQEFSDVKFLSSKLHKEFDCAGKRWRILASYLLAGNMGQGQVLQSDEEADDWRMVEAASIAEAEFEAACGKEQ